jgi:hypothetical protein
MICFVLKGLPCVDTGSFCSINHHFVLVLTLDHGLYNDLQLVLLMLLVFIIALNLFLHLFDQVSECTVIELVERPTYCMLPPALADL